MSTEALVVPVIDLASFPAELEKLAAAGAGLGCFRVINHGMPAKLPAEMKTVVRSLFEIPAEAKLRNVNDDIYYGGYVMPKKLSRFFESFGIYDAAAQADVHSFCSVMQVSPWQFEIISEYVANLHGVMMKLAGKVAESLGLVGCSFQEWSCQARFNCYNFTLQEDIGAIGLPGHTDSGFLTILQEDECVAGLEILNANGNFVAIDDPVPGTFLVIIGDVGTVWSNGRLRNVKHKVVCKEVMQRISIALFLLAPKDDKVGSEAALIDSDHPELYQRFKFKEYRRLKNTSVAQTRDIFPLLKAQHVEL